MIFLMILPVRGVTVAASKGGVMVRMVVKVLKRCWVIVLN